MELKDQPFAPTLAHKLGDVPHVPGLLRRIAPLSGAGDRAAEWLLKVAIERGANHYERDFDPSFPADLPVISGEKILRLIPELAILPPPALMWACH